MSKFNLLFAGEVSEGFEPNQVIENFKNHFQLTDTQAKYIFSGKEIILKKNLTQEEALQIAVSIDNIGGISYFEPIAEELHLPEGVHEDRRKGGDRRKRNDRRKSYRAGISSDRRMTADRRKKT